MSETVQPSVSRVSLLTWMLGVSGGIAVVKFSSTALNDILIFGLVVWALYRGRIGFLNPWSRWYAILFPLHALVVVMLTPFAPDPLGVLSDMAKTLPPLALGLALPTLAPDAARVRWLLGSLAGAVVLVLGWDLIRLFKALGTAAWGKARFFEPYMLNHPNVASMMAGVALLVLLVPLFMERWNWRSVLWRGPLALVPAVYLLLLASRGPQLAFGLSFALCGVLIPGWRRKLAWFVVIVALGLLAYANLARINPRFAEKDSMRNFSERTVVWGHTMKLVGDHPWVGYGYGKKTFREIYYNTQPPASRFTYPHCHHYWLAQLFHTGVVGTTLLALAWLAFLGALARGVWKAEAGTVRRTSLGTLLMVAAFIHLYGCGDFPDGVVLSVLFWVTGMGVGLLAREP